MDFKMGLSLTLTVKAPAEKVGPALAGLAQGGVNWLRPGDGGGVAYFRATDVSEASATLETNARPAGGTEIGVDGLVRGNDPLAVLNARTQLESDIENAVLAAQAGPIISTRSVNISY